MKGYITFDLSGAPWAVESDGMPCRLLGCLSVFRGKGGGHRFRSQSKLVFLDLDMSESCRDLSFRTTGSPLNIAMAASPKGKTAHGSQLKNPSQLSGPWR